MILDSKLEFSNKQVVSANALSDNVLNMFAGTTPNAKVDLGAGEPVWLVVQLATAAASGTGTLTVTLETADNVQMTGAKVVVSSGEVDVSALQPYQRLCALRLPLDAYRKYLAVRYTVDGSLTNGVVNAFMVKDAHVSHALATGSAMV